MANDAEILNAFGRLPSATQILKAVGLGPDYERVPSHLLEHARQRGTALHAAIQYYHEGTLDEDTLHPEVAPGFSAYQKFLVDSRFEFQAGEFEVLHPTWLYCVPVGTLVMAERGARPIEKLSLSDRIYDASGRLQAIKGLLSREYSGPLVQIRARKMMSFSCTPEHLVLTAQVRQHLRPMRRSIDKIAWKRADEIRPGDWLVIPKLTQEAAEPLESPALAYFYGRFVGDGSTTLYRQNRTQRGASRITFGLHEWSELEQLREVAIRYGGATIVKDKRAFHLQFGRTRIAREFRARFGSSARSKRIPPEVMGAEPKIIKEFFRGYYDADGWRHHGTYEASTVSVGLALQLQLLATRLGVLPTIFRRPEVPATTICGRSASRLDRWLIRIGGKDSPGVFENSPAAHQRAFHVESENCFAVPVVHVAQADYCGLVYDIQAGGSFLVNNVAVHNCGHPDLLGTLNGQRVLLDLKHMDTVHLPAATYQLTLYKLAWEAQFPEEPITGCFVLQLKKDGTYRLHPVPTGAKEARVALAAVTVYRAIQEGRER